MESRQARRKEKKATDHCVLIRSTGLFDFLTIIGEYVAESRPTLLGHGDGGPEVRLDLGYAHVDAPVVLADVEVEVLVVDVHVAPFGQVRLVSVLVGAELVQEVGQRVAEFNHSLSWNCNLKQSDKLFNPASYLFFLIFNEIIDIENYRASQKKCIHCLTSE